MTIAGVTGTNGKTSVAHFLAQSWQRVYGNAGMVGTLGYGSVGRLQRGAFTTPDALRLQHVLSDCLKADVERLAMEVSSHALAQNRCQTVQFDAAVFTNLSRDHLDTRAPSPAAAALADPPRQRALGDLTRPDTERQSHYVPARRPSQFDAHPHYAVSRALEPHERSTEREPNEAPATIPSGI